MPAGSSGFASALRHPIGLALTGDAVSLPPAAVLGVRLSIRRTCADAAVSSGVACPDRPFTAFGTWSVTLP